MSEPTGQFNDNDRQALELIRDNWLGGHPYDSVIRALAYIEKLEAQVEKLEAAQTAVRRTLLEHGVSEDPTPSSRDEWGPVCANCGSDEYRIDGYCSCECRDVAELGRDIRAVLELTLEPAECPTCGCPIADGRSYRYWGKGHGDAPCDDRWHRPAREEPPR